MVKKKTKPEKKPKKEPKKRRFFEFKSKNGKKYTLTFQQKLFCELYLEFKGSGVEAIIEAGYDVNYKDKKGNDTGTPNRKLAAVMASENLTKPNICAYITLKLEEYGFSDDNATKQHLFLMNQFADLPSKKAAIDMFYKRKGKYAAQKIKHSGEITKKVEVSVEELEDYIQIRKKRKLLWQKKKKKSH